MTNTKEIRNAALKVLIPLALSVVLFVVHNYFNNSEKLRSSQHFSHSRFESVLHYHQKVIDGEINHIIDKVQSSSGRLEVHSKFQHDGDYSFYLFRGDTLVGWENASINPDLLMSMKSGISATYFANGFYMVQCVKSDRYSVYGLFRIRSGYAYENEYLFESFHSSFNLTSNPDIVTTKGSDGYNISDAGGNYLFSLRFNDLRPSFGVYTVINLICFFLFVISLMAFIGNILKIFVLSVSKEYTLLLAIPLLLVVYFSLLSVNFSPALQSYPLMSPSAYALAWWLPSLGFFVVLAFFVFVWSLWFFWFNHGFVQTFLASDSRNVTLRIVVALLISLIFFIIINIAIVMLVDNSKDLFFFVGPVDLSVIAIGKLLVISFLVFAFILVTDKVAGIITPWVRFNIPLHVAIIVSVGVLWLMIVFVKSYLIAVSVIFSFLFMAFVLLKKKHQKRLTYGTLVWFIFMFSVFVTLRISYLTNEKEKSNRQLLVQNLSFKLMREDDPIAEMFLPQIEKNIATDVFLQSQLMADSYNTQAIGEYLRKNYFEGYFSRYDLQVIPCDQESNLAVTGYNEPYHCYTFFQSMLDELGVRLSPTSSFYFLRDGDGLSTYFGLFQFNDSVRGKNARLFIEINSKPYFVGMGYPELLINKRDRMDVDQYGGYSYVKYVKGSMVSRFGDFEYQPTSLWLSSYKTKEGNFFDKDKYSHLVFSSGDNQTVVMSYPKLSFRQLAVNFSLVFVAVLLFTSLFYAVSRKLSGLKFRFASIEERIKLSFVFMLIVLLIAMCVLTVLVTLRDFETKNRNVMSDRLRSVVVDLQRLVGNETNLGAVDYDYLNQQLQKSSNVFFTDINFYGVDGRLIGTSRPELFTKGVASPMMNSSAFYSLTRQQAVEFITDESIGKLTFMSGYGPFYNYDNKLIGYVNIPYFVGTTGLHQQLSAVLVTILSTYFFFIMMAVGVAIIFSRRIAAPLIAIRENIKGVELGKKNAPIRYNNSDEIGSLVVEYNRMLEELAVSAEKLAASERESTWREMAKQVAHEINNPLTPMKLSVQYLQKAWNDKRADYGTYMHRVTATLIEQIDQLSVIASEFSAFAKMPPMHPENFNIVEKIQNAILLFEQESDVEIVFERGNIGELQVFADSEQMGSVFNNLIKNAIQSIPDSVAGRIIISLSIKGGKVLVAIADNGQGIPPEIREKIFKPNFTTKSMGMGIGLAIVKNIVTGTKGDIWFETEMGKGTTFYVAIPLQQEFVRS